MGETSSEDSYSASTPTRTNYAIIVAFVLSTGIALPVCLVMGLKDKARDEAVSAKIAALEEKVDRLQRDLAAARLKLDAHDMRFRNGPPPVIDPSRPAIFPPGRDPKHPPKTETVVKKGGNQP